MDLGFDSVVPRIVETPAGVILVTLLLSELAVYTLPAASVTIPIGLLSVPPRVKLLEP